MKTRRLTARDISMLRQHIQEKARTTVHQPEGLLQHSFVIPTYDAIAGADDGAHVAERSATGAYLQMYDWDSCLFAQSAHRAGLTGLPLAVVRNFLSLQTDDGFIPRTVSPGRIWDQGDLCKPFLSQTILAEMERTNWAELALVKPMLDPLEKFLGCYRSSRRHESGLYHWRNVLESGVDDSYALLAPHEADKDEDQTCVRYPDGRLLATDLNSYLVAELRAHSKLAFACGRQVQGERSAKEADQLAALIEEYLWDAALNMYVNLDPATSLTVRLRSWTGLAPAFFGVSSPSRVLAVLQNNVLKEEHFLRPFGIASMAASELLSNQSPRGLYGRAIVCNWNGPVWIMPNVLAVRALLKMGMRTQAKNVARRVLAAMIKDLKETGKLHENYNADTGVSLWAPCFMSWNIMALELISLVETAPPKIARPTV